MKSAETVRLLSAWRWRYARLGQEHTTIIIRMLGKAVKLRHCPATVSAREFVLVFIMNGFLDICLSHGHWGDFSGKAVQSQAQVRIPVLRC